MLFIPLQLLSSSIEYARVVFRVRVSTPLRLKVVETSEARQL